MEIIDKDRLDFLDKELFKAERSNDGRPYIKTCSINNGVFTTPRHTRFFGETFKEAIDNAIMAMRGKE